MPRKKMFHQESDPELTPDRASAADEIAIHYDKGQPPQSPCIATATYKDHTFTGGSENWEGAKENALAKVRVHLNEQARFQLARIPADETISVSDL